MPPVLDPSKSKVDGLAFLGLSLARKSVIGHPDSATHQEAFDLNDVLDRDYEFIFSTNDDGWLVGGGEPGPPTTYKLAAKDSAHVEIMRIGTYREDWGGVSQEEIIKVMTSGEILIPQIEALPTAVVANPDKPPELEIRFDMEPQIPDFDDHTAALPVNWQLRFLHNQLFKKFIFPSRFCPGAFHSTILRKAEFRSEERKAAYFAKCEAAIKAWRANGPQPLNTVRRDVDGNPIPEDHTEDSKSHKHEETKEEPPKLATTHKPGPPKPEDPPKRQPSKEDKEIDEPEDMDATEKTEGAVPCAKMEDKEEEKLEEVPAEPCHSGIWLFTDRENITHFFAPNFLPPYNTLEKRKIIMDVLQEEWDEKTLSWKACGEGSMTKKSAAPAHAKEKDAFAEEKKSDEASLQVVNTEKATEIGEEKEQLNPFVRQLDDMVNNVLTQAHICCTTFSTKAEDLTGKPKAITPESD